MWMFFIGCFKPVKCEYIYTCGVISHSGKNEMALS